MLLHSFPYGCFEWIASLLNRLKLNQKALIQFHKGKAKIIPFTFTDSFAWYLYQNLNL